MKPQTDNRQKEAAALEKKRHVYRSACNLLLLFAEVMSFYFVWLKCYNPYFRNPYIFRGNVFAACVYAALTVIIARFYGQQRLGYHRTFNIIFGLSISAILTNITAYFFIVLQAATWYLSPAAAIIYLSAIDLILVIIWSVFFNCLFVKIFPPIRLVLVTESRTGEILAKFSERSDRFIIEKVIRLPEGDDEESPAAKTAEECMDYDAVVIGDLPGSKRNDILKACYARELRTYTLPKISDCILRNSEVLELFDMPVFLGRNHGLSMEQAICKRAMDIVLSFIGLVVSSPLMLVIAIAIKLEDGGPVLFRQERCTQNGRIFLILKFRSMIVGAEKEGISVPATGKDERITKVGRILRAARLDELPQLFNILKGDMSIVGPRPERVEHVREYTKIIPEFAYRLSVKGGLTGYAQVYGRYNTSAYDKLLMDLLYIEQQSLALDLEIILKTIQVLFTKEAAEGFDEEKSKELTKASLAARAEGFEEKEPLSARKDTSDGVKS